MTWKELNLRRNMDSEENGDSESDSSQDENDGPVNSISTASAKNNHKDFGDEQGSPKHGQVEDERDTEIRKKAKSRAKQGSKRKASRDASDASERSESISAASTVTDSCEPSSYASSNGLSSSITRSSDKPQRGSSGAATRVSGETAVSEDCVDAGITTKTTGSDTGGSNTDSSEKDTLDSDQDHSSEAEDDTPAPPEDVTSQTNLSPVDDVDAEGQATVTVEASELVMPEEVTVVAPNVLFSPGEPGLQRDEEQVEARPATEPERDPDEGSAGAEGRVRLQGQPLPRNLEDAAASNARVQIESSSQAGVQAGAQARAQEVITGGIGVYDKIPITETEQDRAFQEVFTEMQLARKKKKAESALAKYINKEVELLIKESKQKSTGSSQKSSESRSATNSTTTTGSTSNSSGGTKVSSDEMLPSFGQAANRMQRNRQTETRARVIPRPGPKNRRGKFSSYRGPTQGSVSPQVNTKPRLYPRSRRRSFASEEENEELHLTSFGRRRPGMHRNLSQDLVVTEQRRRPRNEDLDEQDQESASLRSELQGDQEQPGTDDHSDNLGPCGQGGPKRRKSATENSSSKGCITPPSSADEENEDVNIPSSNVETTTIPQQDWAATGARPRTSTSDTSRQEQSSEPATPTVRQTSDMGTNTTNERYAQEDLQRATRHVGSLAELQANLVRILHVDPNSRPPPNGPARQLTPPRNSETEIGVARRLSDEQPGSNRQEERTVAEIVHRSDGTSRFLIMNGTSDPLEDFVVLSRRHRYGVGRSSSRRNSRLSTRRQGLPPIEEQLQEDVEDEGEGDNAALLNTRAKICLGVLALVLGVCLWKGRGGS